VVVGNEGGGPVVATTVVVPTSSSSGGGGDVLPTLILGPKVKNDASWLNGPT
jgi:hypothetical protein